MTRKVTGGRAGSPFVGAINVDPTAVVTAANNQDITIAPVGTAVMAVTNSVEMRAQNVLRYSDADSSNWVGFRAPATVTSNVTWTLPATDSTGAQVLQSNGSGTLSWINLSSAGVAVSDPGASAVVHYPLFGTNAGSLPTGQPTAFNVRANLSFVPSTGTLNATIGQYPNVIGSASASGTITIRGTSDATKAAASVLFTDNVAATNTSTGTIVVTGGAGFSGTVHAGNFTTAGTMSAGTVSETSSIALKENFAPIDNALDKILQLSTWIYDRKDGSSKNEAGLVAEQVYEIIPNVVGLDEDGNPANVKYSRLTAYLIEAVKTLKEEINELKNR